MTCVHHEHEQQLNYYYIKVGSPAGHVVDIGEKKFVYMCTGHVHVQNYVFFVTCAANVKSKRTMKTHSCTTLHSCVCTTCHDMHKFILPLQLT